MRTITKIIVHCSATPEGRHITVKDIDGWHKANGWSGIGYHWVVYLDGSYHQGREESVIGAHCVGQNTDSIGICYIGGVDKDMKAKDTRTPEQKRTLIYLTETLKSKYPGSKVYGHRDFEHRKACPSFDAKSEYA